MYSMTAVLAFLVALPGTTSLSDEAARSAEETHCVVEVVDQMAGGDFVVGPESCYESLADALRVASSGDLTAGAMAALTGPDLVANPKSGAFLSTFTLGIHFDGANGTGSSISIVGSSCTGGYWNTGGTWANRISSSWNGCYRLRHYDNPNKSGDRVDTKGVGQTDNLPSSMNNRTESVAYYGS